jgi:chemotaxis protein MotB
VQPQPPPAPARPAEDTQGQKAKQEAAERAAAKKLEADIRDVIARSIAGALPNISVTVTAEGLLISLTDDQNFGMFAIASAEPRPAMVVLMEKLGRVIAGYPEPLVVRGHTDGRPYKGGNYDNWRLSSARAHMAYYMLVRGGVDEKRFERIEGHADRNLKVPDDPEAAQNRRIEILLRKPKP